MELYGPRKRGPKPKTFLLKVGWWWQDAGQTAGARGVTSCQSVCESPRRDTARCAWGAAGPHRRYCHVLSTPAGGLARHAAECSWPRRHNLAPVPTPASLPQAQAKAKAKTYEFRSDSARGIRIPYPGRSPQDLASTSRAREGLRNMGLCPAGSSSSTCRAEPPRDRERERERERERGASRMDDKASSPGDSSKKRGPKPRKELLDPSQRPLGESSDTLGDYLDGQKLDDGPPGAGNFPAGHSVIQLARRQDSDLVPCGVSSPSLAEGTGKLAVDNFPARVIKHRAAFLETKGPAALDSSNPRVRHSSGTPGSVGGLYRDMGAQGGRPSLIARIPVARILGDPEEESWSPPLTNLEQVVVTDVTSNFLTVTIKESNTDQGFFKEKR